jgi:hypothetical protein
MPISGYRLWISGFAPRKVGIRNTLGCRAKSVSPLPPQGAPTPPPLCKRIPARKAGRKGRKKTIQGTRACQGQGSGGGGRGRQLAAADSR